MTSSILQPQFVTSLLGPVELVTAPTAQPVTREECKEHSIVQFDDDDLLLDRQIAAAVRWCERSRGVQIMPATYDVPVLGWWNGALRMPRSPLQSIPSVTYYDTAGVATVLASSKYIVRTPEGKPGYIERHPDATWPAVQNRLYPIIIRLVAGWANAAAVPDTIKQAITMLVGHFYVNREAVFTGSISKAIEYGVDDLLDADAPGGYG